MRWAGLSVLKFPLENVPSDNIWCCSEPFCYFFNCQISFKKFAQFILADIILGFLFIASSLWRFIGTSFQSHLFGFLDTPPPRLSGNCIEYDILGRAGIEYFQSLNLLSSPFEGIFFLLFDDAVYCGLLFGLLVGDRFALFVANLIFPLPLSFICYSGS